jgi:hypothetical protein
VDAGQLWPSFSATIAAVAVPAVMTGIAIVPVTIPIAATGVAFT